MGDKRHLGCIQCSIIAGIRLGYFGPAQCQDKDRFKDAVGLHCSNQWCFSRARRFMVNSLQTVCSLNSWAKVLTKLLYRSRRWRCTVAVKRFVRSEERSAALYLESSCRLSVRSAEHSSSYRVAGGTRSYVESCQKVT